MATRKTAEQKQFEEAKLALFRLMVKRADATEEGIYEIARNFWVMDHLDILTAAEKKKYQYLFNDEIQ